jgi:uncharacterized protein with FMN-binding domain
MRVRKYILMKYREKIENAKFKLCVNTVGAFAGLVIFFVIAAAAFTGNSVTKTIAADVKTENSTEKTTQAGTKESTEKITEGITEELSQDSENAEENAETDNTDSDSENIAKSEEVSGGVSEEQMSAGRTLEEKAVNESVDSSASVSEATQAVTQKEEKTEAPRKFKADGTYTGSAVCDIYGYTVTASVTISGDSITGLSIDTTASGLDMDYADKAINGLKRKLVSNQGTSGVDAVSGATYSSNAIFRAFENAVN